MAVPPRLRTRRSRRHYVWKVALAIAAVIVLLMAAAVAAIWMLPLPDYSEVVADDPRVESSPESIERGARLVAAACAGCHASAEDSRFAGRAMRELPKRWGAIFVPNLTRHKTAGIGAVDDAALVRAIRAGIGRDGTFLPPYMPRYPRMADEDLAAIVAFLRSDDPWVAAVSAKPGASAPGLRVKLESLFLWRPSPLPTDPIPPPSRDDPEALGAYLVEDLLQCNQCHGSRPDALALEHPIKDPAYLGGGIEMGDWNGKSLFGANITADEEAGIGKWPFADFKRAMVEGRRPDDRPLRWPMPRYAELDDVELAAIYAYLANVVAVEKPVKPSAEYLLPGKRLDPGRHLYFLHGCFTCHGDKTPHGVLREAAGKFETDAMIVDFLRDPARSHPRTKMPGYGEIMDDEELLALAAYVRSMATAPKNK